MPTEEEMREWMEDAAENRNIAAEEGKWQDAALYVGIVETLGWVLDVDVEERP